MDGDTSTKATTREKLEAELREWGLDVEKFTAKARAAAKPGGSLHDLKNAGAEGAKEIEKGLEAAWSELRKAFGEAAQKFKQR